MAQTIKLKRSASQGAVPTTAQLELGEVAINTYDGKMYIKKNDGSESIIEVGSTAAPTPSGSDGQLQFNNNGVLSGTTFLYADDTNNRLGIGTTTPASDLDVEGKILTNSLQLTGGTGDQGTLLWNSIDGTLDLDLGTAVLQLGQEQHFYAKATEAIANGDVVMFAGAQGDHVLIAKADHGSVGFKPEYIMGVATQAFATNDFGYVTSFGKVRGLNTSTLNEGDILYSDPDNAGVLTTTRPSAPDHVIQMAAVLSSNPGEGVILVRPTHFLDTDEVEEGSTNLYFTDARAVSAIQADASWNASNWDTAYSWGDHSTAGYQSASTALTTSTTFGGDVSGTYNAIVVANDSHTHDGRYYTESESDSRFVNVTGDSVSGNITLTNAADLRFQDTAGIFPTTAGGFQWVLNNDSARIYAQQPASDQIDFFFKITDNAGSTDRFVFWIDDYRGAAYDKYPAQFDGDASYLAVPVDGAGNKNLGGARFKVPFSGNVTVDGSRIFADNYHPNADAWTTARTITLGGVLSGSVSIDGSSNVTLTAAHTSDPTITLTGAVTGTGTMTNLGNVSIATTATADPTLTIDGDASGSATFTNLGNATLTLTIADDSHNHVISNVDGLQTALDAKAPLASPALTGTPTAPTATAGTNTTQVATTAFVSTAVSNLVDSAPTTLDTLNELAAALGDDPNFATTVTNSIGTKWTQDNTKISNWDTAYGWGDHSTAGYQSASTALTTSTTFGGDVSGTYNAIVVANDSHTHDGRYYTESEADSRFVNVTGDTITGALEISFPDASLIFSDETGNPTEQKAQIRHEPIDINNPGSMPNALHIEGTGANLYSTGLVVEDRIYASGDQRVFADNYHPNADKWTTGRTITLGGVLSGSVSIDGSSNVTLTAAHTSDPTITLTGAVTGTGTMTNLGNVSIATTATADPTLTINGDASGSATFTNLGNATLTLTIADDSHNHVISNVDGLQTALDGKLSLTGGTLTGSLKVNTAMTLNSEEATLATTTQTQIAAFSATTYGGGKFVITAKDGVNRHICELLVTHDGTTAVATQYGSVTTASDLATYDVDISGGNVRILATSASTNSTVYKVAETLMEA